MLDHRCQRQQVQVLAWRAALAARTAREAAEVLQQVLLFLPPGVQVEAAARDDHRYPTEAYP